MKTLTTILGLFIVTLAFGQTAADKVLGKWYTDDKETIVEIYKTGEKYFGKVVWLMEENEDDGTPKVDDENPDAKLQKRPIMGLNILKGFSYDSEDKEWADGTIYDPKNGKTYDCYMWIEKAGEIQIKGFVMGMRFIGRSTTWTKAE
ncbi:MAG: DUF2147 domain-containing protein [Bacteroidota bacterium]|nr:DUF2147 domain-containing protein [Bacteroidota bacterium]